MGTDEEGLLRTLVGTGTGSGLGTAPATGIEVYDRVTAPAGTQPTPITAADPSVAAKRPSSHERRSPGISDTSCVIAVCPATGFEL